MSKQVYDGKLFKSLFLGPFGKFTNDGYFQDIKKIGSNLDRALFFQEIHIPDDIQVSIKYTFYYTGFYEADVVPVGPKYPLADAPFWNDDNMCKEIVKVNGLALQFVKNQTDLISKLAVNQNGLALQFVKTQTEKLCKLAVRQNGNALQYIEHQTVGMCVLAIQQSISALEFVKNQTSKLCRLAISKSGGHALDYVRNKTDDLRRFAETVNLKYRKTQTQ